MTNHPAGRSRRAAFTIIELLTVITIILILAGLILGIAGNAQNKAARSRAEGEIQAMSTGCNNYQIDNGTYPRFTDTDALDARTQWDPTNSAYIKASLALYKMIGGSYYTDANGNLTLWTAGAASTSGTPIPKPTVYMPFKDSQLNNVNGLNSGYINPGDVNFISDPFGFSYGYSTYYTKDLETSPTTAPTHGYNPTYDLWSTAGYSTTSGKTYPTPPPGYTAATYNNTLWMKNW